VISAISGVGAASYLREPPLVGKRHGFRSAVGAEPIKRRDSAATCLLNGRASPQRVDAFANDAPLRDSDDVASALAVSGCTAVS
jgi:hypothetical protein